MLAPLGNGNGARAQFWVGLAQLVLGLFVVAIPFTFYLATIKGDMGIEVDGVKKDLAIVQNIQAYHGGFIDKNRDEIDKLKDRLDTIHEAVVGLQTQNTMMFNQLFPNNTRR